MDNTTSARVAKVLRTLCDRSSDGETLAAASRLAAIAAAADIDWDAALANGSGQQLSEEQVARVYGAGLARGEALGYERGILDAKSGAAEPATDELGDEALWARKILELALATDASTDFEKEFATSFLPKVERWDRRCYVSQKQWAVLRRMEDKLRRQGQL